MTINLKNLQYNFDNDGNTTGVTISFQGYNDSYDSLNATLSIKTTDLPDGKTFDDFNKKEFTAIGRNKLAKMAAAPATA